MVSVIVPIFNCKEYLQESITSILNQSYSDFEIIAVDDGSTDGSSEICDEIARKDGRVKVIHVTNGGVSAARNIGLRLSCGEYICFVDGDDLIAENFLEIMLSSIESVPSAAIAICGVNALEEGNISVYRPRWHRTTSVVYQVEEFVNGLLRGDISCTVWNKIYRADLCKGVYFKEGSISEEVLFNYYVSKNLATKGLSVVEIPDMLYTYRSNCNGLTHTKYTKLLIDQTANLKEIMDDLSDSFAHDVAKHMYVSSLSSLMLHLAKDMSDPGKLKRYQKEFRQVGLIYIYGISNIKNTVVCAFLMCCPWVLGRIHFRNK